MRKIKMILPALAVLFAFAAAFATNASPKKFAKVEISIRGGQCSSNGFCTEAATGPACTHNNDGSTLLDTYVPSNCVSYSGLGTWSAN